MVLRHASVGLGESTALIKTRFRRACPGSERTSDGYIGRPIIPPFPREWGEWPAAVW